ncbi:MAG: hypothetical protein NTV58_13525 [Deltaproteobacteria bacterium]|nr:hypothetical protein [Deltaproteobacteria bacterium]
MEKMFGSMMQGFFNGMSKEDKQKMNACCEKMVAMCPCSSMMDMPEEDKKAMMEKMQSFCGDKMEMMSSFVQGAGAAK